MNITTDGRTSITSAKILYVSGVTGGAVMQLQYESKKGVFVDMVDGLLEIDKQYQLFTGNQETFINITGATGTTDIDVRCS